MEDPWVNAWGDPQKLEQPADHPLASTWTSSSKFVTDDQADIAIPSWEADSGSMWNDSPDVHNDLWNRDNRTSQLWATPTFDSIEFAKPSQEIHPEISSRPPSSEEPDANNLGTGKGQEALPEPEIEAPDFQDSSSGSVSPALEGPVEASTELEEISGESSPDPDGFGTFEVAIHDYPQSDPWMPSQSDSAQAERTEVWGAAWKESDEVASSGNERMDEWEMAKRQKEIQDRYVPPEFLDSILRQFNAFSELQWPEEHSDATSDPYQHSRDELTSILGVNDIADRLIPSDLTLSVPGTFTRTFTSKEMGEALKLTRHHLITRHGPLAAYMSSKGSLSWEAAIKSKVDVTEADVVPSGWRIVPKESTDQQPSANDNKKKPTSGLLSFFGRKPPTTSRASGSSSPVRPSTPGAASPRSSTASPRPSLDVGAINPLTLKLGSSSSKEPDASSAMLSGIVETPNTSKVEPNQMPRIESTDEVVQPPSAVSRFLGRFSRPSKSSGSSNRNSIALSSDDLEFLSDIVPSANDESEEASNLDLFSGVIHAPPVPTKLPALLAPPPPPPLPKPLSPPPFVSPKPITPTAQHSMARPTLTSRPDGNKLLGLDSTFPFQITSPRTSAQTVIPLPQPSVHSLLSPLPPPLSPVTTGSRLHMPANPPGTIPPVPTTSVPDEDDFSDFQTSHPPTKLAFAAPLSPPPKPASESISFDDFDDFVSPEPPQVPEKPKSMSAQITPASTPPIFPPPPKSPSQPSTRFKSSSPPKQSIHSRRASRQADSHQRTLGLLETAAARGKWPAPASPLPNAIPPPSMNSGSSLFDVFEEPSGPLPTTTIPGQNDLSSGMGQLIPDSTPLPVMLPPQISRVNGSTAFISNATVHESAMKGVLMPGNLPPVTVPQLSTQPTPSHRFAQLETQGELNPQQWKIPSPPAASLQSSTLTFGTNLDDSKSGTPAQHISRQQPQSIQRQSVINLFSPLSPASLTSQPSDPSNKDSRSGGKLSAQDLSFFESL